MSDGNKVVAQKVIPEGVHGTIIAEILNYLIAILLVGKLCLPRSNLVIIIFKTLHIVLVKKTVN
jgi:hypothetical protein